MIQKLLARDKAEDTNSGKANVTTSSTSSCSSESWGEILGTVERNIANSVPNGGLPAPDIIKGIVEEPANGTDGWTRWVKSVD